MSQYSTRGIHVLMDFYDVKNEILDDEEFLKSTLTEAISKSGATILSVQSHKFEPQGVTMLFLLSESHLSIHTYPERGYCSIDCYTCGTHCDPMRAFRYLVDALLPLNVHYNRVIRGNHY